jgi:hypothetical protein
MALYRCYFITGTDHVAGVQEVEADTDAEAVEQARVLVASQPLCTAELWLRSSLVRRDLRPHALTRTATTALSAHAAD